MSASRGNWTWRKAPRPTLSGCRHATLEADAEDSLAALGVGRDRGAPRLIARAVIASLLLAVTLAKPLAACSTSGARERLELFCITQELRGATISPDMFWALSYRLAGIGQPPLGDIQSDAGSVTPFAQPLLYYSDNVNGGNPRGNLVLRGATFEADPSLVRRGGVVAGTRVGLSGQRAYRAGYLRYHAAASRGHSAQAGATVSTNYLSTCGALRLRGWRYLEGCASGSSERKELSRNDTRTLGVTVSQPYKTPAGLYQEARGGVARVFTEDYAHNQVTLGLSTIHGSGTSSDISLTWGDPISGELVTRAAVSVSLSQLVADRPLSVSLSLSQTGDAYMLGVRRSEQMRSLTIGYPILRGIEFYFGYRETDSTIDYFDNSGALAGLQMKAIAF